MPGHTFSWFIRSNSVCSSTVCLYIQIWITVSWKKYKCNDLQHQVYYELNISSTKLLIQKLKWVLNILPLYMRKCTVILIIFNYSFNKVINGNIFLTLNVLLSKSNWDKYLNPDDLLMFTWMHIAFLMIACTPAYTVYTQMYILTVVCSLQGMSAHYT